MERRIVHYIEILHFKVLILVVVKCNKVVYCDYLTIIRRSLYIFPFRRQAMPFFAVDAIIGNQAFQNERCHILL